ncbi:MAG: type IV pilus modification PilV family protein [Nannocystaceae bacterium]
MAGDNMQASSSISEPTSVSASASGKHAGTPSEAAGFSLLEVMVALAILAISLTSLLNAQTASIRATRYAQAITSVVFLAEYALVDVEWRIQKDGGWVAEDKRYEGNFSEQGWPDVTYDCLIDFIELPEYNELRESKDEADSDDGANSNVQDAGDQAFSALQVVWPMVKQAIENSIRKVQCTVFFKNGNVDEQYTLETFWTDPEKLKMMPSLGGEDLGGDNDGGSGGSGNSGAGRGGRGSSTRPGGGAGPGIKLGGEGRRG